MTQIARLLLVDDDPAIVRLLTTFIRQSFSDSIEVVAVTDPGEALERIENGLVDILVTDLAMPVVDGLGVLRAAKRRNPHTQVLVITACSTLDALTAALELGATDYLTKPINHAELLEVIRHAQERQRRWRAALGRTLTDRRQLAETAP